MEEKHVEVDTKLGRLRGCTRQSVLSGNTYCAFLGIPYAKAPIGELRFKAPEPFGGWEGIKDALKDGQPPKQPSLLQAPGTANKPLGDEDCLFLSVFMNELPKEGVPKKPVMFSIHGGGFLGGSGSLEGNGPDYLLEGDVIVVTFNYRCGAFGFLSLETEEVPGNAGLKDQTLALQWVRDNIDSFGGDPNNVTIFGISAGGASVSFHLISPSSRGLFHKAIVQSGFATNNWAIQHNPRSVATNLAKLLGCVSKDIDDIHRCLQTASADDIVKATEEVIRENNEANRIEGFMFTPCTETSGSNPFLTESPTELMKRGEFYKVPVILGCAQNEGAVVVLFHGAGFSNFEQLNRNHGKIVPAFLGLAPGSSEEKEASDVIWNFYLKGAPLSWDNINDYVTFQSDSMFNLGLESTRAGFLRHSTSPVYTYLFTNHTRCILCQMLKPLMPSNFFNTMTEACHGADCMFLYVINMMPSVELSLEEKEAIRKHVKIWTAFAATGNPNCQELGVTWRKDSLDKPCFMDIGTSWTLNEGIPFAERLSFWKTLTSKYVS